MSTIAERQAKSSSIALLRARDRSYRNAKWIQGGVLSASIALPTLGVFASDLHPLVRPAVACMALILLLIDVGILDPKTKQLVKQGAKLQEAFDVEVLDLPWNQILIGERLEPEIIARNAKNALSPEREEQLKAWYEPCAAEVPIEAGRIICQRTNVSYDASLRQSYSNWVLGVGISLGVGGLMFGLFKNLTFQDFVLSVFVPIAPLLNWVLRERRKQLDTVASLERLRTECAKIWTRAKNRESDADLRACARSVQDGIFQHRSSSPLIFDWVYRLLRRSKEEEAAHAARTLIGEYKSSNGRKV